MQQSLSTPKILLHVNTSLFHQLNVSYLLCFLVMGFEILYVCVHQVMVHILIATYDYMKIGGA